MAGLAGEKVSPFFFLSSSSCGLDVRASLNNFPCMGGRGGAQDIWGGLLVGSLVGFWWLFGGIWWAFGGLLVGFGAK